MSEAKLRGIVERSVNGPVTREWLARDLTALGVGPGMLLMVHTSVSALGFVAGGVPTVAAALRDAVGADGTLVLPAFTENNSEPSHWSDPPVPESWWQTLRDGAAPYDPATTPLEAKLGALPAYFWRLPGTLRSGHPNVPWCAQGPLAERVVAGHSLDFGLGEQSPAGRCYEFDGWVLSLGCRRTSVLHLAETLSRWSVVKRQRGGSAVLVDGERRWVEYDSVDDKDDDFEALRQEFMGGSSEWSEGPTGYATSRLLKVRPLIDFAVGWLNEHRDLSEKAESDVTNPPELTGSTVGENT